MMLDDNSCTKLEVTPNDTHRTIDARTHAYDLLGFYHKEKWSTCVILYEMYLSPDMQLALTLNNVRIRSA